MPKVQKLEGFLFGSCEITREHSFLQIAYLLAYKRNGISFSMCSCASEGEEMAALYNLACAYAALGQKEAALASLEGAFEIGFQDYNACRTDPDLRILQGTSLDALIDKQTSQKGSGFIGQLKNFWKRA